MPAKLSQATSLGTSHREAAKMAYPKVGTTPIGILAQERIPLLLYLSLASGWGSRTLYLTLYLMETLAWSCPPIYAFDLPRAACLFQQMAKGLGLVYRDS